MVFKRFQQVKKFRNNLYEQGTFLFSVGKEIVQEGIKIYSDRNNARLSEHNKAVEGKKKTKKSAAEKPQKETLRKNMEKNFTVPAPDDPSELARQNSMNAHKVMDQDPGEKFNSNTWQRNYDNHKGN